ncbi:hypothetical protein F5884DRAFT_340379 [Xylogone sp. PMI_703]|nr:hypothetical protein F5884DRAFT_340379 [Xylogone sp. PMI_703]
MKDVEREIHGLNNRKALRDLQYLERVAEEMKPLWEAARYENFASGLVSCDLIWKLFHPGDLVVHEDDIGNLWLLVFVEITRRKESKVTPGRQNEAENYLELTTWILDWDEIKNELGRRKVVFPVYDYPGRRAITTLPVYPIHFAQKKMGYDCLEFLTERGRKWWELMTTRTSCLKYTGIALSQRPGIVSRRGREENLKWLHVCN